MPEEMRAQLSSLAVTEKRLGTPDDVAQVCGFLAEEGSRWVNGDTISVTGGADML
jgi:3-oxoacyl-[acyl-carrier protein] reductase